MGNFYHRRNIKPDMWYSDLDIETDSLFQKMFPHRIYFDSSKVSTICEFKKHYTDKGIHKITYNFRNSIFEDYFRDIFTGNLYYTFVPRPFIAFDKIEDALIFKMMVS